MWVRMTTVEQGGRVGPGHAPARTRAGAGPADPPPPVSNERFRGTSISRFKLTAKFPTRNSGSSADFSHTRGTHCGLSRGVPHKIQGLREISHSEIYHREFDVARNPPPPPPLPRVLLRVSGVDMVPSRSF